MSKRSKTTEPGNRLRKGLAISARAGAGTSAGHTDANLASSCADLDIPHARTDSRTESRTAPPSLKRTILIGLAVSFVYISVVLGVHASNPRTLCSMHGFLHAAIVERFDTLFFRPENPFYAGQTLCYYWFLHSVAAMVVRLTSVDPLHALEWVIAGSLVVLSLSGVLLGRRLYGSMAAGLGIGYLALVGANPLGPLIWLAHGMADRAHVFHDNGLATFGPYIYQSQVGARLYGPNLPYFFNITSRPVALAFVVLMTLALHKVMRKATFSSVALLVVSVWFCTAMNPLIGLATGGAVGLALIVSWLWHRKTSFVEAPTRKDSTRFPWWPCAAIATGAILALPLFYSLFTVSQGGTAFVLFSYQGFKLFVAVMVGAGPILWLARKGRLRTNRWDRTYHDVLILAAGLLLTSAIAVYLPVENSCNLFHGAIVLLAVPAAGMFRTGEPLAAHPRSSWRRILLAVLFLPAGLLTVRAYTGRAPIDLAFAGHRLLRKSAESDWARVYPWLERNTEVSAVIVLDPREKITIQGNVPELPAMTRRVLFVGCQGYMTDPYLDVADRRRIATRLVQGEGLSSQERQRLASLQRPIYVVVHDISERTFQRLRNQFGQPTFRTGQVAVFRWRTP